MNNLFEQLQALRATFAPADLAALDDYLAEYYAAKEAPREESSQLQSSQRREAQLLREMLQEVVDAYEARFGVREHACFGPIDTEIQSAKAVLRKCS